MKSVLTLLVGIGIGFGIAVASGKTDKKFVRLDQVTLTKEELEHVVRAIDLLKDKTPSVAYTRYVADSGSVAFDCPTGDRCNLEVPARDPVKPRDVEVTITETAVAPLTAAGTTSALVRRKPDTSVYAKLGLMNGDVVTAINGEKTNSPSEALQRLTELSDRFDQIREVTVVRDGKPIEMSFNQN